MNQAFSFAVSLVRVFDSAPLGTHVSFYSGGQVLHPYEKPGGLYVFTDQPVQPVTVHCKGYQHKELSPNQGDVYRLALYPAIKEFLPPPSWKCIMGEAPPGRIMILVDSRFEIRMTDYGPGAVCLRTRPGFVGGSLLWVRGEERQISLIWEKRPPDCYLLGWIPPDPESGWAIFKVYPAQAESDGQYIAVVPEEFECQEGMRWEIG